MHTLKLITSVSVAAMMCAAAHAESWLCKYEVPGPPGEKPLQPRFEYQIHDAELWQLAPNGFRMVGKIGFNNDRGVTASYSDSWNGWEGPTSATTTVAIDKRSHDFLEVTIFVTTKLDMNPELRRGTCTKTGH